MVSRYLPLLRLLLLNLKVSLEFPPPPLLCLPSPMSTLACMHTVYACACCPLVSTSLFLSCPTRITLHSRIHDFFFTMTTSYSFFVCLFVSEYPPLSRPVLLCTVHYSVALHWVIRNAHSTSVGEMKTVNRSFVPKRINAMGRLAKHLSIIFSPDFFFLFIKFSFVFENGGIFFSLMNRNHRTRTILCLVQIKGDGHKRCL